MSRFSNLTDDEREQLHKLLDDRYLLIKKNRWFHFLGGAAAFLVAVFAVSWAGTRAGLFANRAEAAAKRIEKLEEQAAPAVARLLAADQRLTDLEQQTAALTVVGDHTAHALAHLYSGRDKGDDRIYWVYAQQNMAFLGEQVRRLPAARRTPVEGELSAKSP